MARKLFSYIFLFLFFSCTETKIDPFYLSIRDFNYSLAYSVIYELNENELVLKSIGELEGEVPLILYTTKDLPKKNLLTISQIDLDSLNVYYANPCIDDGDIKDLRLKKDGKQKDIRLSNYYHPIMGEAVELINKMVPEKFQIDYDKDELIGDLKNCGKEYVLKSWEEIE